MLVLKYQKSIYIKLLVKQLIVKQYWYQ